LGNLIPEIAQATEITVIFPVRPELIGFPVDGFGPNLPDIE
jgi:hypothetical protein